jgi:hypothetical protein
MPLPCLPHAGAKLNVGVVEPQSFNHTGAAIGARQYRPMLVRLRRVQEECKHDPRASVRRSVVAQLEALRLLAESLASEPDLQRTFAAIPTEHGPKSFRSARSFQWLKMVLNAATRNIAKMIPRSLTRSRPRSTRCTSLSSALTRGKLKNQSHFICRM